jgi:hypothetical protein
MRPAVGAVAVGQLVQIESGSPELHALVATNRGRTLFEQALPGGMPPVTRRIATLGLVELSCRLHEGERAHLVASPHPFAAVTDATGAFLITGVPPGRHTLTGWHPRAGERGVAVDVAAGAVTEVRLALPGGAPARTEPPVAAAAPEPPAGQSEPVSAEPAPEARPALPPALRAAAQTNGCRFAITADTPVSRACAEGGVKRAKLVMKAIVKQARARAGAALDCDTCHTSEVTFALAVDARGRLEALLRVVETR